MIKILSSTALGLIGVVFLAWSRSRVRHSAAPSDNLFIYSDLFRNTMFIYYMLVDSHTKRNQITFAIQNTARL